LDIKSKQIKLRKQILELVNQYGDLEESHNNFIPGRTIIPPSGKVIGTKEYLLMTESVLDGWLTTGRFNRRFEKKLAKFLGVNHLLTVNSGSSANLVSFNTLTSSKLGNKAISKGDEVISVAAGFPTTVNPIIQFGCIPVFVDVELETHNIDVNLIESAITKKTKAIMLAHTLGNPFNAVRIKEICDKYNLWLIEDTCDALGTTYSGKMCGTFGDIATLSFYPAHHMTMGEGGAVFMNNPLLKQIAESYRDWGRDCYCAPGRDNTCGTRFSQQHGELPFGYDHKYVYSHLGYNLKITDMQAACGLAQLEKLDEFITARKKNHKYLLNKLKKFEDYISLPYPAKNSEPSWFGFPITLNPKSNFTRNELIAHLDKNKIGTRLLFAGNLTKQPYFKHVQYRVSGNLKNTEITMSQTFWVGIYPGLNEQHFDYMFDVFNSFFNKNNDKNI